MKNSKKNQKKNKFTADPALALIPAYSCFFDLEANLTPYEWVGWGLAIRHLREHGGMDQLVLGRLLRGYTRSQISRYETESSEPPVDFWIKLARTFGLNINWVFTGIGVPYITEFQESEERKRFEKWACLLTDREDFLKDLHGWGQK